MEISSGTVIAERTLLLDDRPTVQVRICRPEREADGTCVCRYEIAGLAHKGPGHAYGEDTAQALVLALATIAAVLENAREAKAGRLSWGGSASFGFRYPDDEAARLAGRSEE